MQVTERFRERVVDEGYSPSYGARPLRRAIMRLLEDREGGGGDEKSWVERRNV